MTAPTPDKAAAVPPAAGAAQPQAQPQPVAPVPGPRPVPPPQPQPPQAQPPRPPQPPQPGPAPVPPPVSSTRLRRRHVVVVLSFLLMVLAPAVATGVYLWRVAADQYVSKVGFSVRREETSSALEILGGLTSLSGSSSSDTDILFEFIQSQKLVTDMDAALNLRAIWSRPDWDPVFALDPAAPVEDLVEYWNRMVRISHGKGAGLLEVEVRAFDATDATAIASALFDESSQMINDLSAIAREDAIAYARDELNQALDRLKTAREQVTRFRNENQLVNPELDIQSLGGLLANLQAQQAQVLIEIDLLRDTVADGDPRLATAQRRLEVIERRIAAERQKLGFGGAATGNTAFADVVGEYERLVVDREFAEQAYVSALAAYDGALAEARRKSRYLAAYMQPTRAETAVYPERVTLLSLITLFAFLIWAVVVLVGYSLKDRR